MRCHLFAPSCAVALSLPLLLLLLCLGAGASRPHAGFSIADASEREEKAGYAVHEPKDSLKGNGYGCFPAFLVNLFMVIPFLFEMRCILDWIAATDDVIASWEAPRAEAADAGAAGLVVPDLPLEEAERLSTIATSHGLDLVLLVAPTTPAERMARIHQASRGFTYLVSVTGVTGVRTSLESRVEPLVHQLKSLGDTPVAVGFGISGPEQARQVRQWGADGAIVGSVLVKVMAAAASEGQPVGEAAGRLCATLRSGLDG
jgi:hypothetical protein